MKREDFTVDGIPDGYQVYDVDVSPSGQALAIVGHASEEGHPTYVKSPRGQMLLPEGSVWRRPPTGGLVGWWMTRWAGEKRVLTAMPNCRSSEEINAWIWDDAGQPLGEFHAGDAIQDILADDKRIVVTYFDEGVFSNDEVSQEGLAIFSSAGTLVWGYRTQFGDDAVDIADCYCASWSTEDEFAFFPYGEPNFPFISLNLRSVTQEIRPTPEELHGSNAISPKGQVVYFYSPYDIPTYSPTGRGDQFLAWQIGSTEFAVVGNHSASGRVRGLPGGRFIEPKPDGYTMLSFD